VNVVYGHFFVIPCRTHRGIEAKACADHHAVIGSCFLISFARTKLTVTRYPPLCCSMPAILNMNIACIYNGLEMAPNPQKLFRFC
jgi:hypothetical protein